MSSRKKYSRRDFIKGSAVFGGALALGGYGYLAINRSIRRDYRPEQSKEYLDSLHPPDNISDYPNIIFIMTDDLGFGDIGTNGNQVISTPNLNQMAKEGINLKRFYSTAPLCSPSRAGALTGRYPIRTMVTTALYPKGSLMIPLLDVVGYYTLGVRGIPEDEILVSEILQQIGYKTSIVGKWHLGDQSPALPNEKGFDSFFGALYSNDMDHYEIYRDHEVEYEHPFDQNQITKLMTEEAVDFIKNNSHNPFFLYLAHPMPHEPIHASHKFRGKSMAGLYGDCVEEIDWSVGEILQTIKEYGLDENTLVIFTSDNGPWWQGNPGFNRGRKLIPFEGGFRVPFIARWPGTIPPGISRDGMCMNFDLFATILDIVNVQPPKDRIIDGRSILSMLKGEAESPHQTLYFFKENSLIGVRQDSWKYFRRHTTDNGSYAPLQHGPFLFNLETDPNESYSMIETEPEIAVSLSQLLNDFDLVIKENIRGWQ